MCHLNFVEELAAELCLVRNVYLLREVERCESDANIEMRRDSHQNVLGLFDNKRRIRVWFFLGICKLVQAVKCVKEPYNPYDGEAIRAMMKNIGMVR